MRTCEAVDRTYHTRPEDNQQARGHASVKKWRNCSPSVVVEYTRRRINNSPTIGCKLRAEMFTSRALRHGRNTKPTSRCRCSRRSYLLLSFSLGCRAKGTGLASEMCGTRPTCESRCEHNTQVH